MIVTLFGDKNSFTFLIASIIISLSWEVFSKGENQKNYRPKLPHFTFSGGVFRQLIPKKNISSLLDNLLTGYDQKLRPSFGGPPTIVEIDVEVRSMGRISEMDMTFSMDCYFRQSWVDERLSFSESEEAFTLSLSVLERLWKPDTFIYNGKHSYTHLITTPNRFVRLHHSGKVLYSSRLTIEATCPMNLEDFPMDTQQCPLKFGSFGYSTRDVLYRWNSNRQIVIAADMKLSQFDLIAAPSAFENTTRRPDVYSTLKCSFYLQRHMGNFLIQVYGPCVLLVVLSWVSFWLNREATADRISLGVTTVLTMTFLGLEARTDLPKVAYTTALDLFVWISYGFIFATIIEFAFVHYFTKYGSGEEYPYYVSEGEEEEEELKPPETKSEELDGGESSPKISNRQTFDESDDVCLKRRMFATGNHIPTIQTIERDIFRQETSSLECNCNYMERVQQRQFQDVMFYQSPYGVATPKRPVFSRPFPCEVRSIGSITLESNLSPAERTTSQPVVDFLVSSMSRTKSSGDLDSRAMVRTMRDTRPSRSDDILDLDKQMHEAKYQRKDMNLTCKSCNSILEYESVKSGANNSREISRKSSKKRRKVRPINVCNSLLVMLRQNRSQLLRSRKRVLEARCKESGKRIPPQELMNSVSNIDEFARVFFSFIFSMYQSYLLVLLSFSFEKTWIRSCS